MSNLIPLGCDISKDSIDVFFSGHDISMTVKNSSSGYQDICRKIQDLQIMPHICMEATGNYYEDFANFMADRGYKISVINPLKIKYFARTEFLITKTDKQDAKLIASYCRKIRPEPSYIRPSDMQYQVKRSIALLRQLNGDLTGVKNRLKAAKDDFVRSVLEKQKQELSQHIDAVKQHISDLVGRSDSENLAVRLQSIPSVGRMTAVVLAHFLEMYAFDTENKFMAFAGLSPQKQQSGTSVNKPDRLSKYGNRILKSQLYMPALVAYRQGYFSDFVGRLVQKKKPKKVILVAIMRKLAAIAWNLWKNGQIFDPARYGLQKA